MKRNKNKQEAGGNWMDTYGDLVTLLLCFFVLLYAISAVDQGKWTNLVRSLNPNATEGDVGGMGNTLGEQQNTENPDPEGSFDELYQSLKEAIENSDLAESVQVDAGEGYAFITFQDNVIFSPNSYIIRPDAVVLIDQLVEVLAVHADEIDGIEVLGHTAKVSGDNVNVSNDRFLSSNRATAVLVQMQEKNVFDPSKMLSIGYGEYLPIADNATEEGRSANRRVEILVTKHDAIIKTLEEYYQEIYPDAPVNQTQESDTTSDQGSTEAETSGEPIESAETGTAEATTNESQTQ